MNRNTLLGFLGGILFAASLIVGASAGDAFRDSGGGILEIPVVSGEPIPLIPGEDVTGLEEELVFAAEAGFVPTEVAGEFVLLDEAPPAGESGGGFADDAPRAGDGGGGGSEDVSVAPTDPEPLAGEDRGYPWEVEDLTGFSIIDLLFGDPGFPFLRFLDFCADDPDAEGCPPGTGGTVLAPFDDHLAVGEFRLRNQLYAERARWWTCDRPSGLGSDEYFVLVSASHPARIEIDYYPYDDPGAIRSTVVDLTDPVNQLFVDFVAEVTETGGPPLTGVHHCFVLQAERRSQTYVVEARATSFTGETASETFGFSTREQRSRPPVYIAPINDYEATLVVPVKSEPLQNSVVRLIAPGESLGCADIEDAVIGSRERRSVVPREPGAPSSGYFGREPIGDDIINAPDWRYDSAYDTYQFWTLNLKEGSIYRACIWWVESLDRSYDPAHTGIVERETMRITTPDRLRAAISVVGIEAPSSREVTAGSFVLFGRTDCGRLDLPTGEIGRGGGVLYSGGIAFCDYLGYRQPALTELAVTFGGITRDFVVATPNTGEPRIEQVRLDLSRERGAGLCGSSFGDCDPPTSTVPGPIVYLDIEFTEGDRSGRPGWIRGLSSTFESPLRDTPDFPGQPRMDGFSSTVEGARRDAIRVTVSFDRPVTLEASFEGDLADQCFTGDIPTFSSDELRASYSFLMDGLCTLTFYAVRLEVTDEAGSTVVFTNSPSRFGGVPGEVVWDGDASTLGYDVQYWVNSRSAILDPFETLVFEVLVGGRPTTVGGDDRCLASRITPVRSRTWGEVIDVEIHVFIAEADRVDGRCRSTRDFYYEASITTSFTIEEFMAGEIEIPVALERVGSGFGLPENVLSVVIQGTVVP